MSVIWTDSLASLRAAPGQASGQAAVAAGAAAAGDGGGGVFYWVPTPDGGQNPADDGGIIIAANDHSGTWQRVYSGAINVRWYAALIAVSDAGVADATAAINAAIAAATKGGTGGAVYFPAGTYLMGTPPQPGGTNVYSNLTLFGDGAASVIQGPTGQAYQALFASSPPAVCANLKIMNLRFDQQAASVTFPFDADCTTGAPPSLPCYVIYVNQSDRVVVQDCVFDTCFGVNTVVSGSGSQARVTNCTFNFLPIKTRTGRCGYDNSAVYIEGQNHIISGNFMRNSVWPPPAYPQCHAGGAMETHGGPSVVFGNVSDGYLTGVNVGSSGFDPAGDYSVDPTPSDMTLFGNTYRNSALGIELWAMVLYDNTRMREFYTTLRNVTVVGNTVSLAQIDFSNALPPAFPACAGVAINQNINAQSGPFEGLLIARNHISFQPQDPTPYTSYAIYGIGCSPPPTPSGTTPPLLGAMLTNCAVSGNVIKDAPCRGIDIGHSGTTVSNARFSGNRIINAGGAADASQSAARAAITSVGVSGAPVTLLDVVIDDNCIIDEGSALELPVGQYSYLINYQGSTSRISLDCNRVTTTFGALSYDIASGNVTGSFVVDNWGAQRPPQPLRWEMFYDTTAGKPVWYNPVARGWVDSSGNPA
jgi:hypothetical protein